MRLELMAKDDPHTDSHTWMLLLDDPYASMEKCDMHKDDSLRFGCPPINTPRGPIPCPGMLDGRCIYLNGFVNYGTFKDIIDRHTTYGRRRFSIDIHSGFMEEE